MILNSPLKIDAAAGRVRCRRPARSPARRASDGKVRRAMVEDMDKVERIDHAIKVQRDY